MEEAIVENVREQNITSALDKRAFRLIDVMDNILKIKREDFAELVGVTKTSISIWRNPKKTKGLMQSGANKISMAVLKLGLNCSPSWLLHGIGEGPKWINNPTSESIWLERQIEINYFLGASRLAVVTRLEDNAMQPTYFENDIVGGLWRDTDHIDYKRNYIVDINGHLEVRKLRKTDTPNYFDLYSIYFVENPAYPYEIKNIYLDKVAPIIRVWI